MSISQSDNPEEHFAKGCLWMILLPIAMYFFFYLYGEARRASGCVETTTNTATITKMWTSTEGNLFSTRTEYHISLGEQSYSVDDQEYGRHNPGDQIIVEVTNCPTDLLFSHIEIPKW